MEPKPAVLSCADPEIKEPSRAAQVLAHFVAHALALMPSALILHIICVGYGTTFRTVFKDMKVEVPGLTRLFLRLGSLYSESGLPLAFMAVPVIAGIGAYFIPRGQRKDRLIYLVMVVLSETAVVLLFSILAIIALWFPYITLMKAMNSHF
jgi:hypothetical protein